MTLMRRELADVAAAAGSARCVVEKASIDEVFVDMSSLQVSLSTVAVQWQCSGSAVAV